MENIKKRSNDLMIVKRQDVERSLYVIYNKQEGTFYGKVWEILNPSIHGSIYQEKIDYVTSLPYYAKVPGYYIYITLENYTGYDTLPELYDLQHIAGKMAKHLYEHSVLIQPAKYKRTKEQ